jgi:glutathione S-transferase
VLVLYDHPASSMRSRPGFSWPSSSSSTNAVALFHSDREAGGGKWEDGDQAAIKAELPRAEAALDVFERFVPEDGTVLGHSTIADFAAGPVIWRTLRLPLDFGRWPKLARFRDAIATHPAFLAAGPVG